MSKKAKILLVVTITIMISMLTVIINQQNKIKNNEIVKAQENKQLQDDKQKKLRDHNLKIEVMKNNIIDKTERVFGMSKKIKSGEIKTVDDSIDEIDRIETDTYKMNRQIQIVVESDSIKEDGLNDMIMKISQDLDDSLISMRTYLRKRDIDGFNKELTNIIKINETAKSLTNKLN